MNLYHRSSLLVMNVIFLFVDMAAAFGLRRSSLRLMVPVLRMDRSAAAERLGGASLDATILGRLPIGMWRDSVQDRRAWRHSDRLPDRLK